MQHFEKLWDSLELVNHSFLQKSLESRACQGKHCFLQIWQNKPSGEKIRVSLAV